MDRIPGNSIRIEGMAHGEVAQVGKTRAHCRTRVTCERGRWAVPRQELCLTHFSDSISGSECYRSGLDWRGCIALFCLSIVFRDM